jgi:hypothetical protein
MRDQEDTQHRQPDEQVAGIDERADGDEEEHREEVAERQQAAARFGRDRAFGDGKPAHERGQRKGHAEDDGTDAGQRQPTGDRRDQEEIMFVPQTGQEQWQHASRDQRQQGEGHEAEQGIGHGPAAERQRGQQDARCHDASHVLEDRPAEHRSLRLEVSRPPAAAGDVDDHDR